MGDTPPATDAAITGTIVDADGVGLAGVEIVAKPADSQQPTGAGGGGLFHAPTAISEADGSFSLAPLDAIDYVVSARMSGRPTLRSDAVSPGAVVELRADTGHRLRGRLVDERGATVPAGTIVLARVDGPLARTRIAGLSVFDPSGAFEFVGLAPGAYELQGIAQGHARSRPVRAEVPAGEAQVSIVLGEGARLFGRLVDADSDEPLALALVTAAGMDAGDSILPSLSSTVSDDEGHFELAGVDPGRTSIQANAFAHDGKIIPGIELEPGERHGPVEIALRPVADGERPKIEVTGIGVAIGPAEGALLIRDVIAGGGAESAGIAPGESILAVDGTTVVELGFEDAVQNIRGPVGTTVELELERLDGSRVSLTVERRVVQAP
jgi:hypothetical protein